MVRRGVSLIVLIIKGLGIGVMEMSHRSKEFLAINDKTNEDVRTLLSVPDNYKILLMQGGATL